MSDVKSELAVIVCIRSSITSEPAHITRHNGISPKRGGGAAGGNIWPVQTCQPGRLARSHGQGWAIELLPQPRDDEQLSSAGLPGQDGRIASPHRPPGEPFQAGRPKGSGRPPLYATPRREI